MKVALILPDSSSGRVRLGQYERALKEHDTRVLVWWPRNRRGVARLTLRAVLLARWADVCILVKPRQPEPVIDAISHANRSIVVDVDDAIWEWNANTAARFRRAIECSRLVVAGSEHLVREVRAMRPDVAAVCIRPAVDVSAYRPRVHTRRAPVSVGWIGGPSSLADFTPDVVGGLRPLVASGVAELTIVCSEPLVAPIESRFVPWSVDSEAEYVNSFDIGIMPLRDDPATRGRCGLKAIQYLAAGLPVVATPIGVAPELVDKRVGVFATSAGDWTSSIERLCRDTDLRTMLGAAARSRAELEFDHQIVSECIRDELRGFATRTRS